ncbi:MAG: 16S rRNA (cytidine(1402)-2'-O)-methyltransferase [bacterium]
MSSGETGKLYIVPTPIGNLEDITYRAVRILNEVDLVLCEDTRKTSILFKKYGIESRRDSFHEHNKFRRTPAIIEQLQAGRQIALISEAGTPGVSDPGFYLVREAVREHILVEVLPGACAAIVALVGSALPTDRFTFEGFLPPKKGRKIRLEVLKDESRTLIFYESPHRIERTITDLLETFGDRPAAWGRELTKLHEDYQRGLLSDLLKTFETTPPRGEYTLVVGGKGKKQL